jgi:mannosyl-3-phosphoglycerate phosphatase
MNHIVFSDLDGTLLDEETYSYAAAAPALALLRRLRVPLVLVTSKTRAEVEVLRLQLGNEEPFVVENGGGIFFPRAGERPELEGVDVTDGYFRVVLGLDYREIRAFVDAIGEELGVRGFGDMSDDEVARLTGLELDAARRARRREFTEPFTLEQQERLAAVTEAARRVGIAVTSGGRFHHLIGAEQDKGRAVRLVARTRSKGGREPRTVGLGDSVNDVSMLEAVDVAVVIPRADGSCLRLDRDDVIVASSPGSRGWNAAVLALFEPSAS